MSSKIKISVFFTSSDKSDEIAGLHQLANSLADLELNIYSDFSKYTKLRILELEASGGTEVELWIYYGSVAARDSIPAIVLHQTEAFVLIGQESVPKFILDYRKPVIWFRERTGSQSERKGMSTTKSLFLSIDLHELQSTLHCIVLSLANDCTFGH